MLVDTVLVLFGLMLLIGLILLPSHKREQPPQWQPCPEETLKRWPIETNGARGTATPCRASISPEPNASNLIDAFTTNASRFGRLGRLSRCAASGWGATRHAECMQRC